MLLRTLTTSALLASFALAQLPPIQVPAQNPLTPEKIVLGKILFWDEQLSSDDSMACGTCHIPEFGGTDPRLPSAAAINPGPDGLYATADDVRGSPGLVRQDSSGDFTPIGNFGLRKQATGRLANTTLGAAYHDNLFWDSRASTQFTDPETNQILMPYGGALESQAVVPIVSAVEMAGEGRTWQNVRQKLQNARPLRLASNLTPDVVAALQQNPTYPLLFTAAFGDPAISGQRIAYAIASYERTQIPDDTPWDRFMAGQTAALTATQKTGWILFQGSGRCSACHPDPLFQDEMSHVLGLRPVHEDYGLGAISNVSIEDGAFKTPTLRNAGLRPRLFHNGQSAALGDPTQTSDPNSVQNIYLNGGGVDRTNLDPFLLVLNQQGVTPQDMATILEFVRTGLTDARCAQGLPPFDHPQLRSMTVPPPQTFGQNLAGAIEPFVIDTVPPHVGNTDWKLGLAAGFGNTLAYLGYGVQPMMPGIRFGGVPWNVDVLDGRLMQLLGNPGEPGHATWRLAIPNDNNLANLDLYFQLWALDALAPNGIATSQGERFTIR
jgi:cytochrome c peroxidase